MRRPRGDRARAAALATLPVATYAAFSLLLMRGVWGHPDGWILGLPPDSIQQMWFLDWIGRSPDPLIPQLVTTQLTAPHAVNLAWNTSTVLIGVVLSPLTRTLGPILAYNLAAGLAPGLAAASMYGSLRGMRRGRLAAWAGGWLFGFAPFTVAEVNAGDLLWASLWLLPPLVLLLGHAVGVQRVNPWWLGVAIGVDAVLQLLLSTELLADIALVTVLALLVGAIAYADRLRGRIGYLVRTAAAALLTFAALATPFLLVLLTGAGRLSGDTITRAAREGIDLLSYVVPGSQQLLTVPAASGVVRHLFDHSVYRTAYAGIAAVGLVAWGLSRRRRAPLAFVAACVVAACVVLSLGAAAHVDGRLVSTRAPWTLVAHIPVLQDAIPSRLSLFVDAGVAVLLACAVDRALRRRRPLLGRSRTTAAVALAAVTLLPLLPVGPFAVNPAHPPSFFASRAVRAIPRRTIALVLPAGAADGAVSLLWQALARFRYRMAWSYVLQPGPHHVVAFGPPPGPLVDLVQRLESGRADALTPAARATLRRGLRRWRVGVVIEGPLAHRRRIARALDRALGPPLLRRGPVTVWPGPAWPRRARGLAAARGGT